MNGGHDLLDASFPRDARNEFDGSPGGFIANVIAMAPVTATRDVGHREWFAFACGEPAGKCSEGADAACTPPG